MPLLVLLYGVLGGHGPCGQTVFFQNATYHTLAARLALNDIYCAPSQSLSHAIDK
jgi:hypothetical protein